MPCYSPSYVHSRGDAILCSIFHKAEADGNIAAVISGLAYALIGLSKQQVIAWWEDHKKLDAQKMKEMK